MSVAVFLLVVSLARLGAFAVPLGLFLRATSDPDVAQLLVALAASMTLGTAIGLWPSGWILDRIGLARGLRMWLYFGGMALAGFAASLWIEARPGVVASLAFTAGVGLAPIVPAPRALLPMLVEPARLVRASSIEAVSVEVVLLTAPLFAAGLAAHSRYAIGVGPALLVLSAAATLRVKSARPRHVPRGDNRTLRRCLGLATLAALVGLSGGVLEPALARSPERLLDGVTNGVVLLTAIGIGSVAGGSLTAWSQRALPTRHPGGLLCLHAAGLLTAAITDGWAQVISLLVAGAPLAPLMSAGALWIDARVHPREAGEALALVTTALTAMTGAGQLLAAPLLDVVGPRPVIAFAALPIATAALFLCITSARSR